MLNFDCHYSQLNMLQKLHTDDTTKHEDYSLRLKLL